MIDIKIKEKIYLLIFLFSLYISTIWINFYYLSSVNVDFFFYYDYINYFIGAGAEFNSGHGSFYYFLVSMIFKSNFEFVTNLNVMTILSYSVQSVNIIYYITGIVGIYKLFKLYKIDNSLIFLSLTVFNFFPQSIYMRAVMKPEIVGFAALPWILYYLNLYKKDKNTAYLFYSIPFLIIILTSKPTVAGMTVVYLLIFYGYLIKFVKPKILVILLLVFLITLLAAYAETFIITSNHFFERDYDEKYDFIAPFSVIYKVSLIEVFSEPFFDYEIQINKYSTHANSIINLTILDTFGDYFNQLFDFNGNYFSKNRKDLFTTEGESLINENRVIKYSGPYGLVLETNLDKVRKTVSSILTILFYLVLAFFTVKDKKNRNIYLMPFFGILVLYIISLGIPSPMFNPFLGDTFKVFYYSFLISITFMFVIVKVLDKLKMFKILFVVFWITTIFFIAGHPKKIDQGFSEHLIFSNQYSSFCEVNNFLIFENELLEKIHRSGNSNKLQADCEKQSSLIVKSSDNNYLGRNGQECVIDNKINNEIREKSFCIFPIVSYLEADDSNSKSRTYPYFSMLISVLAISIPVFQSKITKKINN